MQHIASLVHLFWAPFQHAPAFLHAIPHFTMDWLMLPHSKHPQHYKTCTTRSTDREQLTNDGWDAQWRTHTVISKSYKNINALTVNKIGQITFLFPVLACRWTGGRMELAKPLFSWLSDLTFSASSLLSQLAPGLRAVPPLSTPPPLSLIQQVACHGPVLGRGIPDTVLGETAKLLLCNSKSEHS